MKDEIVVLIEFFNKYPDIFTPFVSTIDGLSPIYNPIHNFEIKEIEQDFLKALNEVTFNNMKSYPKKDRFS